jgi:DNA polymerase-3 subunit epsilon
MHHFTAIDFETAQPKRSSICQIGLVRVEDGKVKYTVNQLICPPDNYYSFYNSEIHGITATHTLYSPSFAAVWHHIQPFIQNQIVVAHNGAFDFSCLAKTLEHYGIAQPTYTQQCTYKIYKKDLKTLCREHQITLNHHDALSDAMACAKLYHRYLKR